MRDGGDPVTGWLAGFPGTGAECDWKPLSCEGYGIAFPVLRRGEAYQCCSHERGAGRVVPTCAGR